MGVVIACGLMLAVGLAGVVRWRDVELTPPPVPPGPSRADRVRRYLWWVQLALATAVLSGVLVAGAGGRLAMRLLGATGGDIAQGRLTEADEVVGEVTVGGTIGFIVFVGLLAGLATTLLWFATRPLLPARWVGGVALGAGVLVVLGTRNDPLRPDNPDFDLLGPWWLSILVFAVLALGHGAAVATFSAGLSRWQPLPGRGWRSASYALLLLLVPIFPLGLAALVGGMVYVFAPASVGRVRRWLLADRQVAVARLALVAVVVVAAPGFAVDLSDLVGRGP